MSKNQSLYEIQNDYMVALTDLTDPEMDLPMEAITDTLEGIEGSLKDKAVNVVQFLRNMEATAEAIKGAEEKMRRRRQVLEKRALTLKQFVHDAMNETGITKIDSEWFQLAIQKNPKSVDAEVKLVPDEYKVVEIEMPAAQVPLLEKYCSTWRLKNTKVLKTEIKEALERGEAVPGAVMRLSTRLAIRGA